MRSLTIILSIVAAMFQGLQPQPRHDKYKDDPKAFCFNPATSGTQAKKHEANPSAHKCSCKLMCMIGPDNEISNDYESTDCQLFCTRERCFCHTEEPCEKH